MTDLRVVTLADRRAVYALLDRMLDWIPPARLSVVRDTTTRPGTGTWRPCTVCATTGRLAAGRACRQPHLSWPYGHGCAPCPACDGSGHLPDSPRRGQEPTGTDRMLNPLKPERGFDAAGREAHEHRRWVDAQLVKLAALQRQHDGTEGEDDELARAVRAKERLYRTGSFARLEVALLQLAIMDPLRHHAVVMYLVEQYAIPGAATRRMLDETVDWLAARLPRPIRLPDDADRELAEWKRSLEQGRTAAHHRQREARDRELRDLVEVHGWSLRRAGGEYGLTGEGARKAIARAVAPVATGPVAA